MKALFAAPNPSPVKAALNINGIPVGGVRLPMIPLNDEEKNVKSSATTNERKRRSDFLISDIYLSTEKGANCPCMKT